MFGYKKKESGLWWNKREAYLSYIKIMIIYMKKFLDSDWLREMHFLGNTVQKKSNLVQRRVTNVTFWLVIKYVHVHMKLKNNASE